MLNKEGPPANAGSPSNLVSGWVARHQMHESYHKIVYLEQPQTTIYASPGACR